MAPFPLVAVAAVTAALVVAGCTSPSGNAPLQAGVASVIGNDAAALYTSKPFTGGQQTPEHVWLEQPDGRLLFYHFDQPDVTKATGLMFVGDAFPGRMCLGEQGVTSQEFDQGYVHFHLKDSPSWDAAHGNGGNYATGPQAQGYWLRHIGAADHTMKMGGHEMQVQKGKVFPLMPADKAQLRACEGGGSGAQGPTLGAMMAPIYNDKPYVGGQQTPEHLWFEAPNGDLQFLHFNGPDPLTASGLWFVGDAFPGRFCKGDAGVTQQEFDAGYVHFHLKDAPSWDAAHNNGGNYATGPQAQGYWLRHVGAANGSMKMGGMDHPIVEGQVFQLMPSVFTQLLAC